MTSEEIRVLIPLYLSGQLTASEKTLFESLVSANAELRQEVDELRLLWEDLGALPEEQPSPALRARFYQKLNDIKHGRSRPAMGGFAWWKPGLAGLVRQVAIALALFSVGMFVGREKLNRSNGSTDQVKQLDTEVQNLRQTVALSLMDRQSPTSRLEGISWSSRVDRPDHDLIDALVTVLDHDSNTNVRLSALDALGKFANEPRVRDELVQALSVQDSPLVQIALIDALVHMRDNAAAKEFQRLSAESSVNAMVRQRAQWGLQRLTYQ